MSKSNQATLVGALSALAVATTFAFAAPAAPGAAPAPMTAAHKGTNVGAKGTAESSAAVETVALADQLAVYGIHAGDPIAIVQAAKMKKGVPSRVLDAKKTTEGKGAAAPKTSGYDLDANALLTRAEGMAAGNATIIGLIRDARATKSRGATRGPTVHSDRINAGDTDVYNIAFRGGEQAAVFVSGDGDTDLDLFVMDENGNQICSDTDNTDTMLCRWTPAWTGTFQIRIKNYGRVYNAYKLAVN
jgi:hypothetical protein